MATDLEVAAGVAALISAFSGVSTLFRSWRHDRRANRTREALQAAQALDAGCQGVKFEYNKGISAFGQQFETGDGE